MNIKKLLFRFKPEGKLLNECQNEIEAMMPPGSGYGKAYRPEEFLYWMPIASWLYNSSNVKNCLDIGSAYGTLSLFAKRVYGCESYCFDVFSYCSPLMQHTLGFNVSQGNIEFESPPWPIKFDTIIFTEVIEHLNFHPKTTLDRIRSLMTDDGVLYLSTPDASKWGRVTQFYQSLDEMPEPNSSKPWIDGHIWQFTKDELIRVLSDSGFQVVRLDYAPGLRKRHINIMAIPVKEKRPSLGLIMIEGRDDAETASKMSIGSKAPKSNL